jgi:hypothetical protein
MRLPAAVDLTRAQYSGWACVFCHASLAKGVVSAGRAEGHIEAHDLSVEVFACPGCALVLSPCHALKTAAASRTASYLAVPQAPRGPTLGRVEPGVGL